MPTKRAKIDTSAASGAGAGAGAGAGTGAGAGGGVNAAAAEATSAAETARVLGALPHLPPARVLAIALELVRSVPASAALAARLEPTRGVLPTVCTVCKQTYDANAVPVGNCESAKHQMSDAGYMFRTEKGCKSCRGETAPCKVCDAVMCYGHATKKLPKGATVQFCYEGPHISTWKFASMGVDDSDY